jgi:hypothetical protein
MACVDESIEHLVVDIYVVADWKDFNHFVTNVTASQLAMLSSNAHSSLFLPTKLSITLRWSSARPSIGIS